MSDDSDVVAPLRAVAEALTIWHELDPMPEVDDGYTPETEAWLDRHRSAAAELAAEACWDPVALRVAHGPPWDSIESRPVALGLLISAAIGLER